MNGPAQHSAPRRGRWPRSGENAPRRRHHQAASETGGQQQPLVGRLSLPPVRRSQIPHRETSNIPVGIGNEASAHPNPRKLSGAAAVSALGLVVAMVSASVGARVAVALEPHRLAQGPVVTAAASQPTASLLAGAIERVAAKVLPSVVELQVDQGGQWLEGSGIVLTSDGLIMTNAHVVSAAAAGDPADQGAARTLVTSVDGRTAPFAVVATDIASDIAVVRAQGSLQLAPITLGSSVNLRVGQPVVAIGSPLGLGGTVTSGIISALNRPIAVPTNPEDPPSVRNAIQTDAPINPGNSGGALVDMNGQLIGITSAIETLGCAPDAPCGSIGLGFAIPVDQAKQVARQLIATRTASPALLGGGR
jgi:putative serine protease PepD